MTQELIFGKVTEKIDFHDDEFQLSQETDGAVHLMEASCMIHLAFERCDEYWLVREVGCELGKIWREGEQFVFYEHPNQTRYCYDSLAQAIYHTSVRWLCLNF